MNPSDSSGNQRRAERKRARIAAMVTDVISGQAMGQLGNLSSTGMLLIGPREPRSQALYQVSVALPATRQTPAGPTPMIELGIQEQWHESAASGQVWAGYRIVAINGDDAVQLEHWLATP